MKTAATENGEKYYTQDEIAALIEDEAAKKLEGARRTWESELDAKMEEERRRTEENCRREAEVLLESVKSELAASEKARLMRERELACTRLLTEKKLPASLAPLALDEDDAAMQGKIAVLEAAVGEAIEASLRARIGVGTVPPAGKPAGVSRAALRDLPLSELQKLHDYGTL